MKSLQESLGALTVLAMECGWTLAEPMAQAQALLRDCLLGGHKVLICGNGGSAADAQHFAAELVGRYRAERSPWPAIALTTDTSALTAIGNDYGYPAVFGRQVMALGRPADLLIVVSTSGRSPNILAAVHLASDRGLKVIALTGENGLPPEVHADVVMAVPSSDTPRIQEMHTALLHILCEAMEEEGSV